MRYKPHDYQAYAIDYIQTHPDFILPAFRANETLGFLRKPLNDLCISRPKSRLAWGIELPFDKDYVCYVWFDALINYISGVDLKIAKDTAPVSPYEILVGQSNRVLSYAFIVSLFV